MRRKAPDQHAAKRRKVILDNDNQRKVIAIGKLTDLFWNFKYFGFRHLFQIDWVKFLSITGLQFFLEPFGSVIGFCISKE